MKAPHSPSRRFFAGSLGVSLPMALLLLLPACAAINKAWEESGEADAARRSAESAPARLQWAQPSFTMVPASASQRSGGGLSVAATPVGYELVRSETHSDTQVASNAQGSIVYCRKYTPTASIAPRQMGFTLTIVNGMDRVFRSAGAVISLNIDGQAVAFDQTGISDFLDVVVLPGGRTQVSVWGPSLERLRGTGTVGLLLFDVVSAVDAAGNTTEKQNYEWYFTYSLTQMSEVMPVRFETVAVDRPGGPAVPRTVRGLRCPR